MKNKLIILFFVVCGIVGILLYIQDAYSPGYQVEETDLGNQREEKQQWDSIAPGIAYKKFNLVDPNNIFVTRMDRNNPNIILDSSISQGYLLSKSQTVLDMVLKDDQSLSTWGGTWGNRKKIYAAINGSFFDIETGVMNRGQVVSGWYAKWFDPFEDGSGFVWTANREAFIGECIFHRPEKQIISLESGLTIEFQGINIPRGKNQLVIYTPQFDLSTHTDSNGIEILVLMEQPLGIYPSPSKLNGKVANILDRTGNSIIPYQYIVLSAHGQSRKILLDNLKIGDQIGISQEVTHYKEDCETPLNLSWAKTYASIGGSYYYLRDGEVQTYRDLGSITRQPRTAIAFNESYIYFIVVDGRDPVFSLGMTIGELGSFTKYILGAKWAIAQDGGGSSTMVVDAKVVNYPSDCGTNYYMIYFPLIIKEDKSPTVFQNIILETPPSKTEIFNRLITDISIINNLNTRIKETSGHRNDKENCQRPVANSMMMVLVEQEEKSSAFLVGDRIKIIENTPLRIGPGTNFKEIVSLTQGMKGVVGSNGNNLNGILAKGYYWWYVDFGNVSGWVIEEMLSKVFDEGN